MRQKQLSSELEGDTEYRGAEYRGKTAVRGSEIALCGSEPRFWILIWRYPEVRFLNIAVLTAVLN